MNSIPSANVVGAASTPLRAPDGIRGAAPGDASGAGFEQRGKRADAAGRLDLDVRRGVLAHQPQVVHRGPTGAETGRRLDPIRVDFAANLAQPNLVLVLQKAVLENHLDLGSGLMGALDHRPDVPANVVPVAAEHLADVGHHVQLEAAIGQRLFGLRDLDGRGIAAVREPDHRARHDSAAREHLGTAAEVIRLEADRRHVVLQADAATFFQVVVRQIRNQQRVIDHLGDLFVREIHVSLHFTKG
jgi:hypothetical protein